jgi:hypothetical protein
VQKLPDDAPCVVRNFETLGHIQVLLDPCHCDGSNTMTTPS